MLTIFVTLTIEAVFVIFHVKRESKPLSERVLRSADSLWLPWCFVFYLTKWL